MSATLPSKHFPSLFLKKVVKRLSLLYLVGDPAVWDAFYEYKTEKAHFSKRDALFFDGFIKERRYRKFGDAFVRGDYDFSIPEKKFINKQGTDKKRVVYSFSDDENAVLKLLAFLLYKYDGRMCGNLYSFRRDLGAKAAIRRFTSAEGIDEMYGYKLDISNYFNSIDVIRLLGILKKLFADDRPLYLFFESLLTLDKALLEGEVVSEKRGAMAGTPVSPFLANVYLSALDRHFEEQKTLYGRYSDDIIVFAETKAKTEEEERYIKRFLANYSLAVNEKKERRFEPRERWEYLGIEYACGVTDIARATVIKAKGKIRRKARALYRWKLRKNAPDERALSAFARAFNKKFFGGDDEDEFTWSRWFFPLISTDRALHEIDLYMQENMRYIVTGKHSKANFRTSYETLKSCGYRSLVNEYYKFCKENAT